MAKRKKINHLTVAEAITEMVHWECNWEHRNPRYLAIREQYPNINTALYKGVRTVGRAVIAKAA